MPSSSGTGVDLGGEEDFDLLLNGLDDDECVDLEQLLAVETELSTKSNNHAIHHQSASKDFVAIELENDDTRINRGIPGPLAALPRLSPSQMQQLASMRHRHAPVSEIKRFLGLSLVSAHANDNNNISGSNIDMQVSSNIDAVPTAVLDRLRRIKSSFQSPTISQLLSLYYNASSGGGSLYRITGQVTAIAIISQRYSIPSTTTSLIRLTDETGAMIWALVHPSCLATIISAQAVSGDDYHWEIVTLQNSAIISIPTALNSGINNSVYAINHQGHFNHTPALVVFPDNLVTTTTTTTSYNTNNDSISSNSENIQQELNDIEAILLDGLEEFDDDDMFSLI